MGSCIAINQALGTQLSHHHQRKYIVAGFQNGPFRFPVNQLSDGKREGQLTAPTTVMKGRRPEVRSRIRQYGEADDIYPVSIS
mgnify:CR=1 FL=1